MAPTVEALDQPRKKRWAAKVKTGCFCCRRRRIKCDEGKPQCKSCVKRAWASNVRGQQVPMLEDEAKSMVGISNLIYLMPQIIGLQGSSSDTSMSSIIRLTTTLYLTFLPNRAGKHTALDSAVRCLALAAQSFYSNRRRTGVGYGVIGHDAGVFESYNQALMHLQQAVADPEESLAGETLCATALLGSFESFISSKPYADHIRHLQGVEEIIKHRQPHRFMSRMELQLLQCHMVYIICGAFFGNRPCFLNHKEWRPVIIAIGRLSPELKINMDFFLYACPIFELVYDISQFVMERPVSPTKRGILLKRVIQSGDAFNEWYRQFDVGGDKLAAITSCVQIDTMQKMCERGTTYNPYQSISISQCMILIQNRLRVALGSNDAYTMEAASRLMAAKLCYAAGPDGKRPVWKTPLAGNVIPAILATGEEWAAHALKVNCQPEALDADEAVIGKDAFWRWLTAMNISKDANILDMWNDYASENWVDDR